MARPVNYDLDEVLEKAMEIFWQRGYEKVSMAEIVKYTGLNRGTMYSLFKDKNGLFIAALDQYYQKTKNERIKVLRENPGKKGIEKFFDFFEFKENYKGCLYSNSISEDKFIEDKTYQIVKGFFETIRSELENNLLQAKKMGEFNGDARVMSLTLVTFIHGFHVRGRYSHSKKESEEIKQNILDMIR